jgi:hypothetical protein
VSFEQRLQLFGIVWEFRVGPSFRVLGGFAKQVLVHGIKHVGFEGMRWEASNWLMEEVFANVPASFGGGAEKGGRVLPSHLQ